MRAVIHERFGPPKVLQIAEIDKPGVEPGAVLVRVIAASLNRADWYGMAGRPLAGRPMMGMRRPKGTQLGSDFAGVVEAVGAGVTALRPGDEVFGARTGSLAEYVSAEKAVAAKPANLSFEEAAAVPLAALTALQGLRDHGKLEAGQRVLVNGAGGGVGTFAVQIAKALGASVTAVCSARNAELVSSLGADRVIDYAREDFTRTGERYDLMFDNAGSRSWRAAQRILEPDATVVLVGGPMSAVLGPLGHVARSKIGAALSSQKAVFFVCKPNSADLETLRELVEEAKVRPVVDRRYPLAEIAEAMRYLGGGHMRGKIVIAI